MVPLETWSRFVCYHFILFNKITCDNKAKSIRKTLRLINHILCEWSTHVGNDLGFSTTFSIPLSIFLKISGFFIINPIFRSFFMPDGLTLCTCFLYGSLAVKLFNKCQFSVKQVTLQSGFKASTTEVTALVYRSVFLKLCAMLSCNLPLKCFTL